MIGTFNDAREFLMLLYIGHDVLSSMKIKALLSQHGGKSQGDPISTNKLGELAFTYNPNYAGSCR
jgi:hypothetical protein